MPTNLDPRLNAFRPDLAAESLRGKVTAERYVAGELRQVARASVALRSHPSSTNGMDNEILFGERVRVFDESGSWAWVQLERDGYVGYVHADSLSCQVVKPTHRVSAPGTFLYPAPDIKTSPRMLLSMNAELAVREQQETFVQLHSGDWVIKRHIVEWRCFAPDFVEVAERFIGTPYLWGGRTRSGLDCSGLVQIALEAAGYASPRDTDLQYATLGIGLPIPQTLEGLGRGDLVFWPGHVGIMVDGRVLLHANAHHMAVALEPLEGGAMRIRQTGSEIAGIKRLQKRTAVVPPAQPRS